MGRSSRLILVASLVFALFALWQAYLEYSNYSSVRSTLPTQPFDPLLGYRIGTLETPSPSPTVIPRASATSRGERASYHRNTATATTEASPTPLPTLRPTTTPSPTPLPTTVPSPSPQPSDDGSIRFTVEPPNATWNDTVTVSWEVPNLEGSLVIKYYNPALETFAFRNVGEWYGLSSKGSQTVVLKELFGGSCQSKEVVWELYYFPDETALATAPVTTTIAYPDVPVSLTSIGLTPNPVPAHHPITLTWEGIGGTKLDWYGVPRLDTFGATVGKHWQELRLTGNSGSTSWVLERHAPQRMFSYIYGTPGLPGICGTVELEMTCPFDDWYDEPELRTPESCPTSAPISIPAAYQTFEHGVMVWDGDLKTIHILYEDGSSEYWLDGWIGQPVTYPEIPPESLLLPQQGFGHLWVGYEEIRSKLGWATAPEQGYTMTRQQVKNEISTYWYATVGHIYFTLPNGQVVRSYMSDYTGLMNGAGEWVYLN